MTTMSFQATLFRARWRTPLINPEYLSDLSPRAYLTPHRAEYARTRHTWHFEAIYGRAGKGFQRSWQRISYRRSNGVAAGISSANDRYRYQARSRTPGRLRSDCRAQESLKCKCRAGFAGRFHPPRSRVARALPACGLIRPIAIFSLRSRAANVVEIGERPRAGSRRRQEICPRRIRYDGGP